MGLETPTGKTPGTETRITEAPQSAVVGLAILLLTGIELVLVVLVFYAVFVTGANSPTITSPDTAQAPLADWFGSDQRIISLWLGAIFVNLAYILFLYQGYFMDHVTVAKRRFKKWEDEGVQF